MHRIHYSLYSFIGFLAIFTPDVVSADGWEFSLGTGVAFNQSSNADIDMDNSSDISQGSVDWKIKPFSTPLYYDFRISKWLSNNGAIEIELLHHKLYAESGNLNSRVSNFDISQNLLYCNYALLYTESWVARAGAGVAIVEPDITVDGVKSDDSYQLAGITTQLSLEKIIPINSFFDLSLESKVTYSYSDIDLGYGSTEISNTALHFLINLKYH